MGKLHHATLKSAVAKYASLQTEGKSEEDIKTAIAEDEKGFDTDEVEQIYAAIVSGSSDDGSGDNQDNEPKEPPKKKGLKYIVESEFRDRNDFSKGYSKGEDVSHLSQAVLDSLIARKLVSTK